MAMHRQAAPGLEPQQRHTMSAWQPKAHLLEPTERTLPAHVAFEMTGERRRRPFEARPRYIGSRRRLDGDAVQTRKSALQSRLVERSCLLALHQRATQRAQALDHTARDRVERDMDRH